MMQIQKLNNGYQNEQDLIEAFQALGGNEDKSGSVSTSKLTGICDDFELSIDIGELTYRSLRLGQQRLHRLRGVRGHAQGRRRG